jgi:TRAP-type mannitol/chloroaromatic compound transport system substrate-binding protein
MFKLRLGTNLVRTIVRPKWALLAGTAIALGALVLATPERGAEAQSGTTLMFETAWPTSITLWRGDRYFVDLVNVLAQGEVTIQYNEGGTFTSSTEMFDTVQAGGIDMGSDWPSYWEGRNTAFSLVTSVPMIFNPGDYMVWFWQGGGYELVNELYGQYGLKWFPHSSTGPESGQRTNTEVRTGDDYAGLQMRQCGRNQSRILEDMGGSAVFLPGGEVYLALDRGDLDAAEFSVPEVDWHMGLQEVTNFVVKPGWHQPGPVSGIIMNAASYDQLSDRAKFIMKQAAMTSMMWAWTYFEYASGIYHNRFIEAGTTVTRLDDETLVKIEEATNRRLLDDARENPDHAKLLLSMYDYLVKIAGWRDAQQPFMFGHNAARLEEVHAEVVQIARDHGVYDEVMATIEDAWERNQNQSFWQPGQPYMNNPVAAN